MGVPVQAEIESDGFTVDDVRETFTADMGALLSRLGAVAARLAAAPPCTLPADERGRPLFEAIGELGHTIRGTASLVRLRSLTGTAELVEAMAVEGAALARAIEEQSARAAALARLCEAGSRELVEQLALELDHGSREADDQARAFARRVTVERPGAEPGADGHGGKGNGHGGGHGTNGHGGHHGNGSSNGNGSHRGDELPREAFAGEALLGDGLFDFEDLTIGPQVIYIEEDGAEAPAPAAQGDEGAVLRADLDPELAAVFRDEAERLVAELSGGLDALDRDGGGEEARTALERIFHTLAGSAATIGLAEQSAAASRLKAMVRGETAAPAIEPRALRAAANALLAGIGLPPLPSAAHGDGDGAFRFGDEPASSAAIPVAAAVNEGVTEAVTEIDPELAEIFLAEAAQAAESLRGLLAALLRSPGDSEVTARLEWILHTLKGAASTVGLAAVAAEAAALQQSCEAIGERRLPADASTAGELARDIHRFLERLGLSAAEAALPFPAPATTDASALPPAGAAATVRSAVQLPDPELWEAFQVECRELLDGLDRVVLEIERTDDPRPLYQQAMRLYHTLKGSVNAVGIEATGRGLHRVEDFLEGLEEASRLPAASAVASLLLEAQAGVRRNLAEAARGFVETAPARLENRIAELLGDGAPPSSTEAARRLAETAPPAIAASASDPRAPAVEIDESGADRRVIRVDTERLDALMNFAGELVVGRSRLAARVGTLSGLQKEMQSRRLRLVSTIEHFREQREFAGVGRRSLESAAARPRAVAAAGGGGDVLWSAFSELELDRYEDVQILARSVAEIASDVGELDRQFQDGLRDFSEDADAIGRVVSGIQGEVTRARMIPLGALFTRLRLVARSAGELGGKEVEVTAAGEDVQLDKTMADALYAPLLHLLRNAVAHGIEAPAARAAAGKPARGTIRLAARQESGRVVVEVRDDGAGLDLAALHRRGVALGAIAADTPLDSPSVRELVFVPGLSTRESAGDLSGRGVGCDVVRRVVERLSGSVRVDSEAGRGTTFTLTMPLTMAITRAVVLRHRGQGYAVPLFFAERILDPRDVTLVESAGVRRIKLGDSFVVVRPLDEFVGSGPVRASDGPIVLLRVGAQAMALQVEEVVSQEEIVIKNLGELLDGHPLFAGMSTRGTGELVLVVDAPGLLERANGDRAAQAAPAPAGRAAAAAAAPIAAAPPADHAGAEAAPPLRVLFVDDSVSLRKVAEKALASLGVEVTLAVDGVDALARIHERRFDLVFTDLEMPRMHGYELIRELRYLPEGRSLPIIVVSSRSSSKHREQARALGANEYLTKPFSTESLAQVLERWGRGAGHQVTP